EERMVPRGLVDVRAAAPELVQLPAPAWSDAELRFLVRPEVASRLREAAGVLPSNLRLGFWEGLRPVSVQQKLLDASLGFLRTSCPEARGTELEWLLERYVARPNGKQPPHSTGSAVDLAAVDVFGKVLSPGEPWGQLAIESMARALRAAGLANY